MNMNMRGDCCTAPVQGRTHTHTHTHTHTQVHTFKISLSERNFMLAKYAVIYRR